MQFIAIEKTSLRQLLNTNRESMVKLKSDVQLLKARLSPLECLLVCQMFIFNNHIIL